MRPINPELQELVQDGLKQLGAHVRRARKEAFRESREAFAKRIGCTPVTLDRIEKGDSGVAIGYVFAALQLMYALPAVLEAASPKLLIATQLPADFPADFFPSIESP